MKNVNTLVKVVARCETNEVVGGILFPPPPQKKKVVSIG